MVPPGESDARAAPDVTRFFDAIAILEQFDCAEVRGVVKTLIQPLSRHETCVIGLYHRSALTIGSLLQLRDPKHFQAIASLARTMMELATDLALIAVFPGAVDKLLAFADVELLKSAEELCEQAVARGVPADETSLWARFVASDGARIRSQRELLWPGVRNLNHWTLLRLKERCELLKAPFEDMYKAEYRRLSWYVHAGLSGEFISAEALGMVAGIAAQFAADAYREILSATVAHLQLEKAIPDIRKRLEVARVLAFTDTPEEAAALWRSR